MNLTDIEPTAVDRGATLEVILETDDAGELRAAIDLLVGRISIIIRDRDRAKTKTVADAGARRMLTMNLGAERDGLEVVVVKMKRTRAIVDVVSPGPSEGKRIDLPLECLRPAKDR